MTEKEIFYQSKYDYYRTFELWIVLLGALASVTYFASDCQLFGRFAWETLLPRTFILLPMAIVLFISRKVKSYKVMVPLSYLIMHGIMWCTIWAIYYLPDKQHANEGFIIMHLLFFAMGFCAPFHYSTLAHCLIAFNIVVSNQFNHYESFSQMLLLGIPCIVAICAVNYVMEQVYADHYRTKCELERLTVVDQLTGAYNRHKIRNLNLTDIGGSGVMIVDVDHFKKVNDTYGHEAGDKVLIFTVDMIQKCIRKTDTVIRWGGEEFVIILPNCNMERTSEIAEKIREKIEKSDNGVCPLTVSIGVSDYNGENIYTTVAQADKALYEAKENGRNQVIRFENRT